MEDQVGDVVETLMGKTEPDKRDWEEIVHLLEIIKRETLRKMSKAQLVAVILDLLAIASQFQGEKERQFKEAVENILNRNKVNRSSDESKRKTQIEKDTKWIQERHKETPS